MKRIKVFIAVSLVFILIGMCSCASGRLVDESSATVDPVLSRMNGDMASYVFYFESLEDVLNHEFMNVIFVGEVVTPGEYAKIETSQTFVSRGQVSASLSTGGAEASVRVERVLKGDSSLAGQIVTVGEALTADKGGEYNSLYFSNSDMKRAVFCTFKAPTDDVYVCTVAEWMIYPLDDDGSLHIWPYLEGASSCKTLDDFSALAEKTVKISSQQMRDVIESQYTQLDTQMLVFFTEYLNDPLNNGFTRSRYDWAGAMSANEALRGGAGMQVTNATREEVAAYQVATNKSTKIDGLIKLNDESFRWFMKEHLNFDESLFPSNWVYIEKYNAWFSEDTTYELKEVTCTSGYYLTDTFDGFVINYTYKDKYNSEKTGVIGMSRIPIRDPETGDKIIPNELEDCVFRVMYNLPG